MGKLVAGILGGFSGKVGNVVGGNWKGIDYMRLHVIPADTPSALKDAQREKMSFLIAHGRMNKNTIIDVGFGHSVKSRKMSAMNRFVQKNLKDRDPITDFADTQFSEGVVTPPKLVSATYDSATDGFMYDITPVDEGYSSPEDIIVIFCGNRNDPMADIVTPPSMMMTDEDEKDTRCGTIMYKILSAKKKDGTAGGYDDTTYMFAFMVNPKGECSKTVSIPVTIT